MPADVITIKVNGDAREVPVGETVQTLLERYQLAPDKVAVELNRRLVRAAAYDSLLSAGDEVEIVTFVGGG